MGDCMRRAGEICGARGYDIYDRSGNVVPITVASASVSGTSETPAAFPGGIASRSLLVARH